MKRCRGLARITNYFVDRGMSFPCSENHFYSFLNVERNNNAPPSRLKGIFEALVFARHVFGVVEFQHLIDSRRCLGACGNDPFHIVKQARPSTVKQLCRLHSVLESGEEDWDRLFAGMALYCTYSRSRWADAQHTEEIIYDTLRLQLLFTKRPGQLEASIPTSCGTRYGYWRDNCKLGKTMEGSERQVQPYVGGSSSYAST